MLFTYRSVAFGSAALLCVSDVSDKRRFLWMEVLLYYSSCVRGVSPLFRFFTMIRSCLGYSRRTFQVLRSGRGTKTERSLQVNGNGMDAERMEVNGTKFELFF